MQKDIFLSSEGNQWYERNQKIEDVSIQIKYITSKYINGSDSVLEIGCSDGRNLNYINQTTGAGCFGIDPSSAAINAGISKNPNLNLKVGTADILDYSEEQFDVVIFGFCLYLVDCKLLLKAISEADRVLKNNGLMINIDFDSKIPKIRTYKHCNDVFSHKYDFNKFFEAIPFYHLVEKQSFSHYGNEFNRDPRERIAVSILYKDIDNSYILEKEV